MHVITLRTLVAFWTEHPDAKRGLVAWHDDADKAKWQNSADIKQRYPSASIINRKRVVFNICGNQYRLIARVNYISKTVFVRFIGTHEAYDKVDVETI